jgi:hypothetical protein
MSTSNIRKREKTCINGKQLVNRKIRRRRGEGGGKKKEQKKG